MFALAVALLAPPRALHAQPTAVSDTFPVPDSASVASALKPAPPRDYVADIRAAFTPENRAYSSSRTALAFVGPLYSVVVAVVLLFSGLSARMRDLAHALARRRYPRVLVYFTLYTV